MAWPRDDGAMTDAKRERRGHFRGKPRPGRRVEVRFRIIRDGQLLREETAYTKNIGVGGAFIFTETPADAGTHLSIVLSAPASARPLEIQGEVRWTAGQERPLAERGMGVKFASLDVDQLLALNDYF